MASVHLLSVAPPENPQWDYAHDDLNRVLRAANRDQYKKHRTTDDPDTADIILFVENCTTVRHYLEVLKHPIYRAHSEKCFLFTKDDHPIPFLPGIYPSIPRRWYDSSRTRSGFYLDIFDKEFITYDPSDPHRDYLYSFIGKMSTHPVRKDIANLSHSTQFIFNTSPYWPYGELDEAVQQKLEHQYVDVAQRSQFVLCPRGRGTSSIRLFEMMKMGRAPVIISDEWVPPEGPDWDQFSIRVDEEDVGEIPSRLAERAHEAIEMGERAREAWESWFSPASCFHRMTEWCLDIKRNHQTSARGLPPSVLRQLLHPKYCRHFLRTTAKKGPSILARTTWQSLNNSAIVSTLRDGRLS